MEDSAAVIWAFDLQFVCGLLQTEDYARAVTVPGHRDARAGEIDRRVAVRRSPLAAMMLVPSATAGFLARMLRER
jgi:Domain of unknown function (DUF5753)